MRKIIFFHGADCPHCKHMMPIVNKIEKELRIKIEKKEVRYNENNADEVRKYEEIIREASPDGDLGVPAFIDIVNEEALVGEQLEIDLKEWLMQK